MSDKKYITVEDVNNARPTNSRLTAIEFVFKINSKGKKERHVLCVCQCGNETSPKVVGILTNTISCGCLNKENAKNRALSLEEIKRKVPKHSKLTVMRFSNGLRNY